MTETVTTERNPLDYLEHSKVLATRSEVQSAVTRMQRHNRDRLGRWKGDVDRGAVLAVNPALDQGFGFCIIAGDDV